MMKSEDEASDNSDGSAVQPRQPDRHQLALAILAIATAAIGFGLFGADFHITGDSFWSLEDGTTSESLLVLAFFTLVSYAGVLISTGQILLRDDNPSGVDLVKGPLLWMGVELMLLALMFIINILHFPK